MLHWLPWFAVTVGLVSMAAARGHGGVREVGAADALERAARAKRKRDRLATMGRKALDEHNAQRRAARHKRRSQVDCCAASSDDWRDDKPLYKSWFPPDPVEWDEAYQACFRESQEAAERGDYSKPASRRCVLGKMHEMKRAQWDQCRSQCAGSALAGLETWAGGDGVQWWTSDEGRSTAGVRGEGALGWSVYYQGPGERDARLVDVFERREQAEDKALSLLSDDIPF